MQRALIAGISLRGISERHASKELASKRSSRHVCNLWSLPAFCTQHMLGFPLPILILCLSVAANQPISSSQFFCSHPQPGAAGCTEDAGTRHQAVAATCPDQTAIAQGVA